MTDTGPGVALLGRVFPVGRPEDACAEMRARFTLPSREGAKMLVGRDLNPGELPLFEVREDGS